MSQDTPWRRVVASDVIYRMISSVEPCSISDSTGLRRPLHIDRSLGGDGNNDPKLLVWHKRADEIFEALANYCDADLRLKGLLVG
jgi:hypothetical protein